MIRILIFEALQRPVENRTQAGLLDILYEPDVNTYEYASATFGAGVYLVVHQVCSEGDWAVTRVQKLTIVLEQVQVKVE